MSVNNQNQRETLMNLKQNQWRRGGNSIKENEAC